METMRPADRGTSLISSAPSSDAALGSVANSAVSLDERDAGFNKIDRRMVIDVAEDLLREPRLDSTLTTALTNASSVAESTSTGRGWGDNEDQPAIAAAAGALPNATGGAGGALLLFDEGTIGACMAWTLLGVSNGALSRADDETTLDARLKGALWVSADGIEFEESPAAVEESSV